MSAPQQRMDVYAQVPELYQAMQQLEQAIKNNLDYEIFELVKLSSSQING